MAATAAKALAAVHGSKRARRATLSQAGSATDLLCTRIARIAVGTRSLLRAASGCNKYIPHPIHTCTRVAGMVLQPASLHAQPAAGDRMGQTEPHPNPTQTAATLSSS